MLRRLKRKVIWKATDALNWLACRSFKRAEYRIPLDRDATRVHSVISKTEQLEVNSITAKVEGSTPGSTDTPKLFGWCVLGCRDGVLHRQRDYRHADGGTDCPVAHTLSSPTREESTDTAQSAFSDPLQVPPPQETCRQAQMDPSRTPSVPPSPLQEAPLPSTPSAATPDPRRAQQDMTMTKPALTPPSPPTTPRNTTTTTTTTPLPPLPPLSTTPLTPQTLHPLLETFDRALSHTRYAVSGHAALMVWGHSPTTTTTNPPPSHVSIVCPAEDREVILSWARAAGWLVYCYPSFSSDSSSSASTCVAWEGEEEEEDAEEGGEGDGGRGRGGGTAVIEVPLSRPGLVTEVWGFRVRAVRNEAWGGLWRVRPAEMVLFSRCVGWTGEGVRTRAMVVAVPSLVDEFARAWYFCVVKGGGRGGSQERHIAGLILWGLWVVVAGDVEGWTLTPENVPCLVYQRFLDVFLDMYPEALWLLRLCGLHGLRV